MSEAEEMALLRTTTMPAKHTEQASDPSPLSFGASLRMERQRRHMTLVQIENELKTRMYYLQAIEDEKFSLLPRGPAALEMIQSYAGYMGVEAETVLADLVAQGYGEMKTPLVALGGTAIPRAMPRWIIPTVAIVLALLLGLSAILIFDPSFFGRLVGG